MKKHIIFILTSFIMISCKNDKKNNNNIVKETIEDKKNDKEVYIYPQLTDIPEDIEFIFTEGYLFSNAIQLDEVSVYSSSENKYNILFHLNETKNFKKVENYVLGLVLYPKDLSVLTTDKQKKNKSISVGISTEIKTLQGNPVLVLKNLDINTNEFNLIKIYFYNKEEGVLGGKILRLTNIRF